MPLENPHLRSHRPFYQHFGYKIFGWSLLIYSFHYRSAFSTTVDYPRCCWAVVFFFWPGTLRMWLDVELPLGSVMMNQDAE